LVTILPRVQSDGFLVEFSVCNRCPWDRGRWLLIKYVETLGQTAGHACVYGRDRKLLICGDRIIFDVAPNITLSIEEWNPPKEYLFSFDKVCNLDAGLVLPGYRSLFKIHGERVQ